MAADIDALREVADALYDNISDWRIDAEDPESFSLSMTNVGASSIMYLTWNNKKYRLTIAGVSDE